MPPITSIGAAASAIVLMLATGMLAVRAQETPPLPAPAEAPAADPNAVVARVGDATVTEQDIQFAHEAFEGELANVPEAQKRNVVIDAFVNMQLLAQGARAAGLDRTEEFAARLEFMKLQALRNAYVRNAIVNGLTDAEIEEGYRTLVLAEHKPEEEVHARHILVDKKEDAEKIIEQLKAGGSFDELAKQSKDPSGQNGGDVGFFGRGQMVKPFEEAAFGLEPGGTTEEPVESQFGWHVIRVEEKRMSEPPSLEQVEEQLRNYLLRQKFETVIAELRDKYPVEIVGQEEEPAAAPSTQEVPPAESAPAEGSPN
jgi:peptidyl-prolyl cis-trans isomerase C